MSGPRKPLPGEVVHAQLLPFRPSGFGLDDALVTWSFEQQLGRVVTVLCNECGGGPRAALGWMAPTPVGAIACFEIVATPEGPRRRPRDRFGKNVGRNLGWRHRGEPGAPVRAYLLDDPWGGLDGPRGLYCPAHSWPPVMFGDLWREYAIAMTRPARQVRRGPHRYAV